MKKNVIKKNDDFNNIIQNGKKITNSFFVIYYLSSKVFKDNEFKIGISVGKKFGNAPNRNYQKRIVREIIKKNYQYVKSNYVVIISKNRCKKQNYQLLENMLIENLKEIK